LAPILAGVWLLVVLTGSLGFAARAAEPAGRIGKLPGGDGARLRGDVLAGRVRLLGKAMDDAIAGLEDGDLQRFTESYRHMVRAYGQLGDHLGDSAEAIGDARARVELADETLRGLDDGVPAEDGRRQQLAEDIGAIREQLVARLGALLERYQQAAEPERRIILPQLAVVVSRVEQLDQVRGALAKGHSPVVPGTAAQTLGRQLESMGQALSEEERALGVLADSIGLLVDSTSQEMYRSIRVMEIEARMPHEQIRQLQDTRAAANDTLRQLTEAHRVASKTVMNILTRGEVNMAVLDREALLQQASQLVRVPGTD
jgi:hypothetical protein